MLNWYVLYTKPRGERQVEQALTAHQVETYVPVVPAASPRRGRPAVRPFFPCYLFARVDLPAYGLSRLNWTPGIRHVVSFGGVPARVDEGVIARIRERLAQPRAIDEAGEMLESGDRVRITAGPLQDVEAIFDKRLSAQGRVRVLVQMLRHWTACEIDAAALHKLPPFMSRRAPAARTRFDRSTQQTSLPG